MEHDVFLWEYLGNNFSELLRFYLFSKWRVKTSLFCFTWIVMSASRPSFNQVDSKLLYSMFLSYSSYLPFLICFAQKYSSRRHSLMFLKILISQDVNSSFWLIKKKGIIFIKISLYASAALKATPNFPKLTILEIYNHNLCFYISIQQITIYYAIWIRFIPG